MRQRSAVWCVKAHCYHRPPLQCPTAQSTAPLCLTVWHSGKREVEVGQIIVEMIWVGIRPLPPILGGRFCLIRVSNWLCHLGHLELPVLLEAQGCSFRTVDGTQKAWRRWEGLRNLRAGGSALLGNTACSSCEH